MSSTVAPATESNAPVGSIRGTLWSDANANGTLDGTELKLAGRTVYLDQNQNGQRDNGEASAIADPSGA